MANRPAARELAAYFETEVNLAPLRSLDRSLATISKSLKSTAAGFQTFITYKAVQALTDGFEKLSKKAIKYQSMADRTGLPVEEYQRFELAAEMVGISAESAAGRIVYLTKTMGLALQGGKFQKKGFDDLGVSLRDTAGHARPVNEVLLDIADRLENFDSAAEKGAQLVHIFGRVAAAKMMPMLVHGRKALEEMFGALDKTGGGLSGKFVRAMNVAGRELIYFKHSILNAFAAATENSVLPWSAEKLALMREFVNYLGAIARKTQLFRTLLTFVGTILGGFAIRFAAMHAPLLAIVSTVGGLYLIFDDLFNYLQGHKSVFGDLAESTFGAEKAAQLKADLGAAYDWMANLVTKAKEYLPNTQEIRIAFVQAEALAITTAKATTSIWDDLSDFGLMLWSFNKMLANGIMAVGEGLQTAFYGAKGILAEMVLWFANTKLGKWLGMDANIATSVREQAATDASSHARNMGAYFDYAAEAMLKNPHPEHATKLSLVDSKNPEFQRLLSLHGRFGNSTEDEQAVLRQMNAPWVTPSGPLPAGAGVSKALPQYSRPSDAPMSAEPANRQDHVFLTIQVPYDDIVSRKPVTATIEVTDKGVSLANTANAKKRTSK